MSLASIVLVADLAIARAQSSGGYGIRKSVIAGGGGTVTGGVYRVTGTAGLYGAGPVSGGGYSLSGGFWSRDTSADLSGPIQPDPTNLDKTRFISFVLPDMYPTPYALRVVLASLHHVSPPYSGGPSVPFTSFEGQARWVGPPIGYVESSSNQIPFFAAQVQCTPHYQDWNTVGLLHVTGSAIVPSSRYRVEMVPVFCEGVESSPACLSGGANVSAQLTVETTRWGDVEGPYNPPDPTVQPDLGDVSALLNKFRGLPDAPIKARALLVSGVVFGTIDIATEFSFIHIAACVDAFRGQPYPHLIEACP